MNTQKYARLCRTFQTLGKLLPLEDIENPEKLNALVSKNPEHDWYSSAFYFTQDAMDYFNSNNGSIKDYPGIGYSKKLIFDFDHKDIEMARQQLQELSNRLANEGVNLDENVVVYFSGQKGFHLEVSLPGEITNLQAKAICSNLSEGLGAFDPKIYNVTRLYRLPNTKHNTSGLYKIPMTYADFMKTDAAGLRIKAAVKRPEVSTTSISQQVFDNLIEKYAHKALPIGNRSVVVDDGLGTEIRGLDNIDFSKCPKYVPRCFYAMQQGVMQPGERNEAFFRLARYYKNQGLDKRISYRTMKGVAELNRELYPDADLVTNEELWATAGSAYSDGNWKTIVGSAGASQENELMKKYCDAIRSTHVCTLHGTKDESASVYKIEDVSNSFESYAGDLDHNTVFTGIDFIDDNMRITVGTTTLLVGATGSGKTTLALNILENSNSLGQHAMFFSMDMHKNLVYLKLAQKLTSYTQAEILGFYKNKIQSKVNEIKELIAQNYDKTFFDFTSTLTMEQMKQRIVATEERTGKKIKLVIVDYASRISSQFSDTYSNAKHNALMSTGVAADTNAAWVYICQIARNTGDGNVPLRSKRVAKESGDWEESASGVITVWRPFLGKDTQDQFMRIYLAKNRMGREIEDVLKWDGAKGTIKDLTDEEKIWYGQDILPTEQEIYKAKFGGNKK